MSPGLNCTMGRIVAKAWSDRAFVDRLVDNPPLALHELEIAIPQSTRIVVVENTHDRICLVLSAPPIAMPLSPLSEIRDFGEIYRDPRLWPLNWLARDPVAANRMVMDPVRELANLGVDVPKTLDVSVLINRVDVVHMILPNPPDNTADRTGILELISSGYMPSSLRFGRLLREFSLCDHVPIISERHCGTTRMIDAQTVVYGYVDGASLLADIARPRTEASAAAGPFDPWRPLVLRNAS